MLLFGHVLSPIHPDSSPQHSQRKCSCARKKWWLEDESWLDGVLREKVVQGVRAVKETLLRTITACGKSSSHHRDGEEDETCGCSWSCVRGRSTEDTCEGEHVPTRHERHQRPAVCNGTREVATPLHSFFLSLFYLGIVRVCVCEASSLV